MNVMKIPVISRSQKSTSCEIYYSIACPSVIIWTHWSALQTVWTEDTTRNPRYFLRDMEICKECAQEHSCKKTMCLAVERKFNLEIERCSLILCIFCSFLFLILSSFWFDSPLIVLRGVKNGVVFVCLFVSDVLRMFNTEELKFG